MPEYLTTIGLEVHVQLSTKSKLFCADSTVFGAKQNSQVGVVSLAYPGALPVLNERAIELALRLALAAGSEIADTMMFDRKNYFYPDLPKGYQITQDRAPIARGGYVPIEVDGESFHAQLTKMHLEEDAGKSVHDMSDTYTYLDYNRAGVPLIEIVTEPVFSNARQVAEFLTTVRRLVRYLEVSDANMEEGSLRCDVNISLRLQDAEALGKKVEIKNLNSIRFVQKAIESEQKRQAEMLDRGKEIVQETRLFDAETGQTRSMRKKETLTDYRYFPDPDLPVFHIDEEIVEKVRLSMPATPWFLRTRLIEEYGLPAYDADVLTEDRKLAEYFIGLAESSGNAKLSSNLLMGPIKALLNESGSEIDDLAVPMASLARLIRLIDTSAIPNSTAIKVLFPAIVSAPGRSVDDLADELGLMRSEEADSELSQLVDVVWNEFPDEADQLKNGKKKLVGMFMGEIMKRTAGKADPGMVRDLLMKKIG